MGTAAASSNETLDGFSAKARSGTETYSAKLPLPSPKISPNTASPGRNCLTFLPTASTHPAMSAQRIVFLGFNSPTPIRRIAKLHWGGVFQPTTGHLRPGGAEGKASPLMAGFLT